MSLVESAQWLQLFLKLVINLQNNIVLSFKIYLNVANTLLYVICTYHFYVFKINTSNMAKLLLSFI